MPETVTVVIEAVDKLSNVVVNITDNFKAATESMQQNAQSLVQSFERVRNAGLALAAAGAAISGALFAMAKAGGDYAARINEAAKRTGLAVEQMSLLRSALSDLEVPADALDVLLNRLVFTMNRARAGAKMGDELDNAAAAFARLGISVTDAHGQLRNIADVFTEVMLKLAQLQNDSERAAIAMLIFGRSAYQLLPALRAGRDEILQTLQAHRAAGVILRSETVAAIDAMQDSIGVLQTALQALSARITAGFAPSVKAASDAMISLVGAINAFLDKHPQLAAVVGTTTVVGGTLASVTGTALATTSQLTIVAANWGALAALVSKVGKVFAWLGGIFAFLKWVVGAVAAAISALAAALGLPVWAVVALIAGIAALIAALLAFRDKIWEFVKGAAVAIWNFLKELWATIKEIPGVIWDAIKGLIQKAYEWGKNIILSIAKGIWDYITYPIRAFIELLRRLREMLPFSDPKVGPLRDLSRATRKIGEMVASSLDVRVKMPTIAREPVLSAVRAFGTSNRYVIEFTSPERLDSRIENFIRSRFIPLLREVV
jgi:TP901 family phage tail tape measure protein